MVRAQNVSFIFGKLGFEKTAWTLGQGGLLPAPRPRHTFMVKQLNLKVLLPPTPPCREETGHLSCEGEEAVHRPQQAGFER